MTHFRITDVLPGAYSLRAIDRDWVAFGLGRPQGTQLTIPAAGPFTLHMEMEPLAHALQARCKDPLSIGAGPAVIAGRIVDSSGAPRKATVELDLDSKR